MVVYACDWTHWQGEVLPADRIADEGFGMVKLKAGGAKREGWHFEDPYFTRNADALLAEPRLIPGVFWYMMPGRPNAQAALLFDLLQTTEGVSPWAVCLDLEEPGVKPADVTAFVSTWWKLTGGKRLWAYTSYRYWQTMAGTHSTWGSNFMPVLEEARWVPESVRKDSAKPYASQQAKAIDPLWWDISYGGWDNPTLIQFTDYALVAGKRTTASIYRGGKDSLRGLLYG